MSDTAALLVAYRDATGAEAAIWEQDEQFESATLVAASSESFCERSRSVATALGAGAECRINGMLARRIGPDSTCFLVIECDNDGALAAAPLVEFAIARFRRLERERDGATRELAERYEEINLLYAIAELLGGDLPVEVSAGTVLRELAVTIGANSAVFLLADSTRRTLVPIASLGLRGRAYPSVSTRSEELLAARVFRAGSALSEAGDAAAVADPVLAADGGAVLAAAITRANTIGDLFGEDEAGEVLYRTRETPTDMTPLGVVLFGRRDGTQPFSAGDRKLVVAAAAQLGTALHNATLMRAAVEREHLAREMRLAHDLQLKLLPDPHVVGPEARAAARVIPAESVGGDFFLLARLDAHRTGVIIGDVSGHGYQAALVMALALSAAGIHLRSATSPAETLDAVAQSLHDELESTEMSLSVCYLIIDETNASVHYANAGHPHVFHQARDGQLQRLAAQSLPIGFGDGPIQGGSIPWSHGDRLVCFTDGVVDVRDKKDRRLGEDAILQVIRETSMQESPTMVLNDIIDCVARHRTGMTLRDDVTVVVVDRGGVRA